MARKNGPPGFSRNVPIIGADANKEKEETQIRELVQALGLPILPHPEYGEVVAAPQYLLFPLDIPQARRECLASLQFMMMHEEGKALIVRDMMKKRQKARAENQAQTEQTPDQQGTEKDGSGI